MGIATLSVRLQFCRASICGHSAAVFFVVQAQRNRDYAIRQIPVGLCGGVVGLSFSVPLANVVHLTNELTS